MLFLFNIQGQKKNYVNTIFVIIVNLKGIYSTNYKKRLWFEASN